MRKIRTTPVRIFSLIFILVIIISWFLGANKGKAVLEPFLNTGGKDLKHFEEISHNVYLAWGEEERITKQAYLAFASAHGYGGKIITMVVSSLKGKIINTLVVDHRETYSFFRRVLSSRLFTQLAGKTCSSDFNSGNGIDGVTGATYTVRGIVNGTKTAIRNIGRYGLKVEVPKDEALKIDFSFPEIILIGLFVFGFIGIFKKIKYKKTLRWISIISGLILIGFVLKKPLSINFIIKIILGSFPAWQEHFYWYLLLILVLIPIFSKRFNLYCDRICPFGALQEGISMISGTKRMKFKGFDFFKWIHRFAALAVISIALINRKPAIVNYEVFGVFFNLIGSTFKFILLGIVLLFSFLIVRPWCNLLCPLRVILDSISIFREWFVELKGKKTLKVGIKKP